MISFGIEKGFQSNKSYRHLREIWLETNAWLEKFRKIPLDFAQFGQSRCKKALEAIVAILCNKHNNGAQRLKRPFFDFFSISQKLSIRFERIFLLQLFYTILWSFVCNGIEIVDLVRLLNRTCDVVVVCCAAGAPVVFLESRVYGQVGETLSLECTVDASVVAPSYVEWQVDGVTLPDGPFQRSVLVHLCIFQGCSTNYCKEQLLQLNNYSYFDCVHNHNLCCVFFYKFCEISSQFRHRPHLELLDYSILVTQ